MRVRIEAVTDLRNKPKHSILVGCERYVSIGRTMTMAGVGVANRVHTSNVTKQEEKNGLIRVTTLNTIYVLKKLGI